MRTTIRDVANAVGVSSMAVSAVLHGTGRNVKVSEEKAELIRKVAKELRYQPNRLAQSLRSQRTQTVGLVFQHFSRLSSQNPYYPQLLNGVMAALFPAEYTLALCPKLTRGGSDAQISDGRFDGVLWCRPDFTEASVEALKYSSIPVVMLHAPPGTATGVPTFCADNELAMKRAVDHLVALGHEKVAFVVDPVSAETAEAKSRSAGFLKATKEAGLEAEIVIWDHEAYEIDKYRLGRSPHTALVAFSDHVAGRLLAACHRFDIRVPQELSVIGFDSSSFCETTTPRLTSLYQPVERMAFEATSFLLRMIEANQADMTLEAPTVLYDCTLDVRESTGPPYRAPRTFAVT